MARVVRLAVLPNGSDRWIANLSKRGMSFRHNGQWIQLTEKNTKIAKSGTWLTVI